MERSPEWLLLESVRKLIGRVPAGTGGRAELEAEVGELIDACEKREWESRRPRTLVALIPWLFDMPWPRFKSGEKHWPVWGRYGSGAFCTDGKGCLVVLDVPGDRPISSRLDFAHGRGGAEIEERCFAVSANRQGKTIEKIRFSVFDDTLISDQMEVVRIGDDVFDGELVDRWVLSAHRITGGPIFVDTQAIGNLGMSAARFYGRGWMSVLMPYRVDREKIEELPDLLR